MGHVCTVYSVTHAALQLLYLLRQKDSATREENFHLLLVLAYHLVSWRPSGTRWV